MGTSNQQQIEHAESNKPISAANCADLKSTSSSLSSSSTTKGEEINLDSIPLPLTPPQTPSDSSQKQEQQDFDMIDSFEILEQTIMKQKRLSRSKNTDLRMKILLKRTFDLACEIMDQENSLDIGEQPSQDEKETINQKMMPARSQKIVSESSSSITKRRRYSRFEDEESDDFLDDHDDDVEDDDDDDSDESDDEDSDSSDSSSSDSDSDSNSISSSSDSESDEDEEDEELPEFAHNSTKQDQLIPKTTGNNYIGIGAVDTSTATVSASTVEAEFNKVEFYLDSSCCYFTDESRDQQFQYLDDCCQDHNNQQLDSARHQQQLRSIINTKPDHLFEEEAIKFDDDEELIASVVNEIISNDQQLNSFIKTATTTTMTTEASADVYDQDESPNRICSSTSTKMNSVENRRLKRKKHKQHDAVEQPTSPVRYKKLKCVV